MASSRHEPFEGFASLRQDVDRLLEGFFERSSRALRHFGSGDPAVEVADTPDTVIVRAQVPGVSKDNLQVNITDDSLTLQGEVKEEEHKAGKNYYQQEFRYGAFSRTIVLPALVQADKATAQLKDGVLEITMPKGGQAKAREVPIQG